MKKQSNSSYIYTRDTKKGKVLCLCTIDGKRQSTGLIDNKANRISAAVALKGLNDELTRKPIIIDNTPTNAISKVFEEFIKYSERKSISEKRIYSYKSLFGRIFPTANFPINLKTEYKGKNIYYAEKLVAEWVESFKNKYESNSINTYINTITVFFKYAYENDYIEKEMFLAKRYGFESKQYEVPKQYTQEELTMIFTKALFKDKEFALYFLFLLYSGTRLKEALNLQWSAIDYENRTIALPNKNNKKQIEYIPISNKLLRILNLIKQLKQSPIYLKRPYLKKINSLRIFRWNNPTSIQNKLISIQEGLGIRQKKRLVHASRKNFAQLLLDSQIDLNLNDDIIKLLIRHKDIELTKTIYAKVKAGKQVEIMNQIIENRQKVEIGV